MNDESLTTANFTVGQPVLVAMNRTVWPGVVTEIARVRLWVRHPKNRRGTVVEMPYQLRQIVLAQKRHDLYGWGLVCADGSVHGFGHLHRKTPYIGVPVLSEDQ